ncbi:DeoR/GlpR family DNA-binding transcription regulator [Tetragenococcus koreensis]|uniref:DeoR/GlpR family DNA-binding transcription regulator n=1 Tax=Tetragenococcus koreensis TaxID=290335 RepID=UPI000F4DE1A5|nr:DeoR/GlpR family DNA-binding transcription regulator [Tetragenococcus koreensis]AYW46814.1 DeoR family transcriptional regulator [Tetragenococcus koreensis]GEN90968.1 DeoR family transcriptional regulator [Tetragenococcus koreensis]
MLTEKRHQLILDFLTENDIVTISELMKPLKASESTIRRDLKNLEEQGMLARIHGGAKKMPHLSFEATMAEKEEKFHQQKVQVAKFCASLLDTEDVVYLDAGTTTIEMIQFIPQNLAIKVVTNSVKHASLLIDRQIETIILGGMIKLSTNATLGATAIQQLRELRFSKAFLGMNGAELEAGFTTPDPEEAAVKKWAMKQSQQNYVLIDHSKLQQIAFAQVAPLKTATIITDSCPQKFIKNFQDQTTLKEVK